MKAGPRGYFAVAKIVRVIPKPGAEGRFLAIMEPGSYLEFDRDVPRLHDGRPWEAALAASGEPALAPGERVRTYGTGTVALGVTGLTSGPPIRARD